MGLRNGQRVQRTDHLEPGDTLVLSDCPVSLMRMEDRITVWWKVQLEERTVSFEIRGQRKELESFVCKCENDSKLKTQCTRCELKNIDRAKTQRVSDPTNLCLMTSITVQMDQESFQVNSPLGEQERRIRMILRERYNRPDSTYVLKMGPYPCSPRKIEQGCRTVTVFSQLNGGSPDRSEVPEGMMRTKYKLSDGIEYSRWRHPVHSAVQ
jgi:hypothetical protein